MARRQARRPSARVRDRSGREPVVDALGAARQGRSDRRAHRLRPERRLARRGAERDRRRRGDAAAGRGRRPAATVRLVNWADEEGARFGRSLFGSSAASGTMDDQDELRAAQDADGIALPDALSSTASSSTRRSRRGRSSNRGRVPGAAHRAGARARVDGHSAGRRARDVRRRAAPRHLDGPGRARGLDADGQAPRRAGRRVEARAGAARDRRDRRRRRGVHVGRRRLQAGDRHVGRRDRRAAPRPARARPPTLESMLADAKERSERYAAEEDIEVAWERIWHIDPILFDDALIGWPTSRSRRSRARRTACRAARCTTPPRSPGPAFPR